MPLPRDVENLADDPGLHNPLERSERMSTGWFGVRSTPLPSVRLSSQDVQARHLTQPLPLPQVLMEYDGVVVEDTSDLQRKAWLRLAEEEGKAHPPQFALRRADGMKNDQAPPCGPHVALQSATWWRALNPALLPRRSSKRCSAGRGSRWRCGGWRPARRRC